MTGHVCHDVTEVVGYKHCTRFDWWSWAGAPLAWELGTDYLHFDPGHVDEINVHTTLDRPVTAHGASFRAVVPIGHLYFAMQFGVAEIGSAPHLQIGDVEGPAHGHITQATAGIGFATELGGLTLIHEIAPGLRFTNLQVGGSTYALPSFDLYVRERVDAWLTPNITLDANAGIDVLDRGYTIGLAVGLHLTPFDGRR